MGSGTNYSQEYEQAEKAYREGNFTQAAEIIDRLAEEFSDNPNILLLRGHIYFSGFQNYELAEQQYQAVLGLSSEEEIVECAHKAIEQVRQLQQQPEDVMDLPLSEDGDWSNFDRESLPNQGVEQNHNSALESNSFADEEVADGEYEDPFAEFDSPNIEQLPESDSLEISNDYESIHNSATFMVDSEDEDIEEEENLAANSFAEFDDYESDEADNEMLEVDEFEEELGVDSNFENNFAASNDLEIDTVLTEPHAIDNSEGFNFGESSENDGLDYQDELEFDEIDSSFFDLEELEQGLPDTGLFNVAEDLSGANSGSMAMSQSMESSELVGAEEDDEDVSDNIDSSLISAESEIEPVVEVKQGFLGGFINAPMSKKPLLSQN